MGTHKFFLYQATTNFSTSTFSGIERKPFVLIKTLSNYGHVENKTATKLLLKLFIESQFFYTTGILLLPTTTTCLNVLYLDKYTGPVGTLSIQVSQEFRLSCKPQYHTLSNSCLSITKVNSARASEFLYHTIGQSVESVHA